MVGSVAAQEELRVLHFDLRQQKETVYHTGHNLSI